MASSENQGLQIALIVFVMLTILLSVTTFMFFREYDEASRKAAEEATKATKQAQAEREAIEMARELRKIIGVPEGASLSDVQKTHEEDMKKYAATAPDDSKFYHQALEFSGTTLNARTAELIAARDAIQQEQAAREKVEKAKQEQVAAAEQNAQKAEADLAAAKKTFEDDRKRMTDDMADLQRQLKDKNDAMTELADTSKKQIDELTSENQKFERDNEFLTDKNKKLDPTSGFEVPDGKIVWVDQGTRSAYINVGRADGLLPQTSFSVVAGDEQVGSNQRTKGRIEVTRILDAHFAECRILEDKLIDPLLEGDKIYTPLWHPGRSESFAIVGFIDLDKDGSDDRELVRDLIRLNGGSIDAEDVISGPDAGKQIGQLNLNTRYLIMGEAPKDSQVHSKAYTKMINDARHMGVREISVSKFLDQVGWKNPKDTLVYGRRGNANDVPVQPPDGGRPQATGDVTSAYRVRRPLGSRGLHGIRSQGPAPQPATSDGGK
jgi:hypothetical protein